MSIELVMPSNHLILCRPLLLLPSIFPSIRVFSNESALCIRWLKYWSFSFSISPYNEHPGLIPFRMGWLDLFAVQRTLKSLGIYKLILLVNTNHFRFSLENSVTRFLTLKFYISILVLDIWWMNLFNYCYNGLFLRLYIHLKRKLL